MIRRNKLKEERQNPLIQGRKPAEFYNRWGGSGRKEEIRSSLVGWVESSITNPIIRKSDWIGGKLLSTHHSPVKDIMMGFGRIAD
jgi:hypothetical protein